MKNLLILTVMIILLSAFVTLPAISQQAPEPIGKINAVNGPISYDKGGKAGYSEVDTAKALDMPVFTDDKAIMGSKTTAEITFNYGATIRMSENTEMQFGSYNLRINKGDLWVNYKPVKTADNKYIFKVMTPTGTIGIKGTTFSVNVNPQSLATTVSVTEGKVGFTSNENLGTSDITSGEKLVVSPGQPVGKPVKIESADHILNQTPEQPNINGDAPIMIDYNGDGLNMNTDVKKPVEPPQKQDKEKKEEKKETAGPPKKLK